MDRDVIVIGGNHHNTLAVLRSLGERGVRSLLVVVSKDPKPYVGYSKYVRRISVVPSVEGIPSAMHALRTSREKAVVIACADSVASCLDMHRDALSADFILPGCEEQGRVTRLMNKDTMTCLAAECGLCVPKSWTFTPPHSGREKSACDTEKVVFPCIVKPLASKDGTKADIAICKDRKDLETCLSGCRCAELQVQEYIDKDIEFQLIGCSLGAGGEVIIPGASVILRQPKNTNTGFLRYVPASGFRFDRSACEAFVRRTGYSGLFSLEFVRGKDGKDYFMEINFRNDGNSICVTASGINLPYIWYRSACGQSIDEELCYWRMREVLVMPEFNDIGNAVHGRISWGRWLADVWKTDRFMEWSKRDPKPFFAWIAKRVGAKI